MPRADCFGISKCCASHVQSHYAKWSRVTECLRKIVWAASAVVFVAGGRSLATQGIELGASVGWYQPLGSFRLGSFATTDLPEQATDLRGIAWGGEARLLLRERAGIEAIITSAASTTPGCTCPGGHDLPPTGQRVNIAALDVFYHRAITPSSIAVGLGPAMIEHGGNGYGRYGSPKSWGGVGVIEVSRPLVSHVDGAARILAAAYSFHLDYPPQSGPQLDLLLLVSIRWRLRDVVSHAR